MYIQKRGKTYRVEIRRQGVTQSKSFKSKAAAETWGRQIEAEIEAGRIGQVIAGKTLADALQAYAVKISPQKRGERWEVLRITAFQKRDHAAYTLTQMPLQAIKAQHITEWREKRGEQVSQGSVLREWNLLSDVFTRAKEWNWISANPMIGARRPDQGKPRNRAYSDEEVHAILAQAKYSPGDVPTNPRQFSAAAFAFALETAMRAGEICRLQPSDIQIERKTALVRQSKNGDPREVPLSRLALSIVRPLQNDPLFNLTPSQLDANFRNLKKAAGITDATFHDSRATALTRLAPRFQAHELAKISGHKSLNILLNTYYRVDMSSLADRLD